MIVRTRRALRLSGGRKALTVLEIASTPVSDEPPLANARSTISRVAPMIRPLPWWTEHRSVGVRRVINREAADEFTNDPDDDRQRDHADE